MKIRAVKIDMEVFGAQFANMDDKEQAAFFKGLAGELRCWKSMYNAQMQFHSVGQLTKQEDKNLLSETVSCIWYQDEEANR